MSKVLASAPCNITPLFKTTGDRPMDIKAIISDKAFASNKALSDIIAFISLFEAVELIKTLDEAKSIEEWENIFTALSEREQVMLLILKLIMGQTEITPDKLKVMLRSFINQVPKIRVLVPRNPN